MRLRNVIVIQVRNEESGLYYHGARYYIPWLCRWCACDPLESKYAGLSPYNYSFNNPVMFNDPSGMEGEDVIGQSTLAEVTITAKRPEGAKRETVIEGSGGYGMDMPTDTRSTTEYWHGGSKGYASGWYNENAYVDINSGVMLGLIASQDPKALRNTNPGIDSKISSVANLALDFIEKNEGNISPNFLNLLSKHSTELVRGFRERNGDAIYPSAFDPIADFAPSILMGLGKALIGSGTKMIDGFLKASLEISTANSRTFALDALKADLKVLAKAEFTSTAKEVINGSQPIIRSLGAASKAEMMAKKFHLDFNSPYSRQVLNSLDEKVETFISNFRKSSIYGELPGGQGGHFAKMTIEEALKSKNTTVRKLLIDKRFLK